jgi:clan AA aspartic protease
MGKIRVKVLLINSNDAMLPRQKKLAKKKVRTYEADALVDTGAVMSIVPPHVLQKLGVGLRGTRVAEYADGRKDEVNVSEGIIINVMGRDSLEEVLILGDEVLIAQTVLEKLDLHADCRNRRLIPNPAHPDQPVLKVK